MNLQYLGPAEVGLDAKAADPDSMVLPRSGEELFRLR